MKKSNKNSRLVLPTLLMACLPSVQAADADATPGIRLGDTSQTPQRNQFGLNYWLGVNVGVDFKRLGGFPRQTNPGPATGGGIDRYYDDGINLVDSSGNAGGLTWNWGYETSAQTPNGDLLVMNSAASHSRTDKNDVDEGSTHGVELTYRRDVGRAWFGRWGLEGAMGYTGFTVANDSTLTTSFTRTSDYYVLNGVLPPLSPYQGTIEGPGPVISDSPQRELSVIKQGAVVAGKRELETDLFAFRFGPYWEVPLAQRVAASLSGGLAMAVVDSEFRYRESVTITEAGTVSRSGSASQTEALVGAYLAGNISYSFTDHWKIAAGAQWHYLGDHTQNGKGKSAVTDFDDAIFITVGLGYSF